eukprot:2890515-Rhodomonas_salina.2
MHPSPIWQEKVVQFCTSSMLTSLVSRRSAWTAMTDTWVGVEPSPLLGDPFHRYRGAFRAGPCPPPPLTQLIRTQKNNDAFCCIISASSCARLQVVMR